MTEYTRITITLEQEVMAGRNARADFRQDTHQHIPGSVLRGALAAVWIARHGTDVTRTPPFLTAFEGDGSFGPLFSARGRPVPLSVLAHKYDPGDCPRRWWDRALRGDATHCEHCREPFEASKGKPQGSVDLVTRTTSALDTDGVALDGKLFSHSAIAATTRLSGWVFGDAADGLMLDGEPITTVSLGSRRSLRGRVHLTTSVDTPEPLERDGSDVILRLASPAVFCDEFGFPADTPDHNELTRALGVNVEPVVPADKWVRWDEVGGWHAASGLPKPAERAVAAGTTYLLRCENPPTDDALRMLHARGIGLRRREGFGALYTTPESVGETACAS